MKNLFFVSVIFLLGLLGFFAFSSSICISCNPTGLAIDSVSVSEFDNTLREDVVLIDIRTPEEFAKSHIKGAINMDFYSSDFVFSIAKLDRSEAYFIYCRTGSRTGQTLVLMREMGFENVRDLSGGINEWERAGLPVVSS